jgi:hypothetical protein
MATNLLDMIMQAQGGASAKQAGKSLGLNQSQTQKAISALLPAISSALKQNTQSPQGLAGLLNALQNGNHSQYISDPKMMGRPETITDGNAILGHLFGSKDVSRAVAGHAAQQTGIGADLLKKLLPMVASMAMGGISQQTRQPDMKSQLAKLAIEQMMGGGAQSAQSSGLGGLLGSILGGGQARQQRQVQRQVQQDHQQGLGLIGKMLDADGDGNLMDDVLKMAMNQALKSR